MVRTANFGPSSISIAGEDLHNLLALYTQDVRVQASGVALSNSKIHCHTKYLFESIPRNRAVSCNKQGEWNGKQRFTASKPTSILFDLGPFTSQSKFG